MTWNRLDEGKLSQKNFIKKREKLICMEQLSRKFKNLFVYRSFEYWERGSKFSKAAYTFF